MAAAGPASSFVLALALYVANKSIQWPAPIAAVISYLMSLNALLALLIWCLRFPRWRAHLAGSTVGLEG